MLTYKRQKELDMQKKRKNGNEEPLKAHILCSGSDRLTTEAMIQKQKTMK